MNASAPPLIYLIPVLLLGLGSFIHHEYGRVAAVTLRTSFEAPLPVNNVLALNELAAVAGTVTVPSVHLDGSTTQTTVSGVDDIVVKTLKPRNITIEGNYTVTVENKSELDDWAIAVIVILTLAGTSVKY